MSMFSEICAEQHNKELCKKGFYLAEAIEELDWDKVEEIVNWLKGSPFNE